MITPATTIRRVEGHVAGEVDGEVMLMHAAEGRWFALDDIASDIWRRLEQPMTLEALCAGLARDYDADAGQIRRDVESLLLTLHTHNLIELV
jgi:hypothetical protein